MKVEVKKDDNRFLFVKDNEVIYWSSVVMKGLKNIKQLHKGDKLVSEIKFKFRLPLKLIYDIYFPNQKKQTSLTYKNIFKPRFICDYDFDSYELIPHKGLKTSIFKNGKQIGFYEHKKIEYIGQQTIFLITDSGITEDIIFSFILAVEGNFKNDSSTVSFDFGNFGPEIKPFDTTWKPL